MGASELKAILAVEGGVGVFSSSTRTESASCVLIYRVINKSVPYKCKKCKKNIEAEIQRQKYDNFVHIQ